MDWPHGLQWRWPWCYGGNSFCSGFGRGLGQRREGCVNGVRRRRPSAWHSAGSILAGIGPMFAALGGTLAAHLDILPAPPQPWACLSSPRVLLNLAALLHVATRVLAATFTARKRRPPCAATAVVHALYTPYTVFIFFAGFAASPDRAWL